MEGSVHINLPAEDHKQRNKDRNPTPKAEIHGIHYRCILKTIHDALDNPDSPSVHFEPYKEYWRPSENSDASERVYGELYAGDAWYRLHKEVRSLPVKGNAENFLLPLILYSDSTHLTNFGTAALWPIYVFFGNLSKYIRCRPNEFAAHHLAYIPSVRIRAPSVCAVRTHTTSLASCRNTERI